MATVKIENIEQARTIGAEYGVAFPALAGRPPMRKLAKALKAAGVEVNPTPYFDGVVPEKVAPAGQTVYKVQAKVQSTDAKGRTSKRARVIRVNVDTIRKLAETTGLRGRPSQDSVVLAAARVIDVEPDALSDVTVTRLVPTVTKTAEEQPKARKAAKATPVAEVVEVVATDVTELAAAE
jgi:hypothetical protein